ncbi:MAG: hypothetical protein LBS31_10465 [Candidatus Adiutrix sp.]|jgi:hypothetical protein|nr:hypothetical protein [Candidatus Adiutrix sp.]
MGRFVLLWVMMMMMMMMMMPAAPVWAFNFDQYQPGDLDAVWNDARFEGEDSEGLVIFQPQKLRLEARLNRQAYPCPTGVMKTALTMLGLPPEALTEMPISRCLEVSAPSGRPVVLYIQDVLAEPLSREIPSGGRIILFCDYIFRSSRGPGLLLNEFQALPAQP